MTTSPSHKFGLDDLRAARPAGRKLAMLTCYDYTTACLMEQAKVPLILVGDSAANVILGYPSTIGIPLCFLIELTAAVRRGAPNAFLVADMPFGSYHASTSSAMRHLCRMMGSGCDCIKMEVAPSHLKLVRRATDAGIPIMAHMGLRPQSVAVLGGYKVQGRAADAASAIVDLTKQFQDAGAVSILLEAVPSEVSEKVVQALHIPIIGCGAGPACDGHVFVTHDALGLTPKAPRFAPHLADMATPLKEAFARYVTMVASGEYPAGGQVY